MKALALIILAVALVGCGTTTVVEPAIPAGPSSAEQASIDFITEHAPELDDIFSEQTKAVEHMGTLDFDSANVHIDKYVALWNKIKDEWEGFPAGGGRVAAAELYFENSANHLRDISFGLVDILEGKSGENATTAVVDYVEDRAALDAEMAGFTDGKSF
jgi:hypothetical protein